MRKLHFRGCKDEAQDEGVLCKQGLPGGLPWISGEQRFEAANELLERHPLDFGVEGEHGSRLLADHGRDARAYGPENRCAVSGRKLFRSECTVAGEGRELVSAQLWRWGRVLRRIRLVEQRAFQIAVLVVPRLLLEMGRDAVEPTPPPVVGKDIGDEFTGPLGCLIVSKRGDKPDGVCATDIRDEVRNVTVLVRKPQAEAEVLVEPGWQLAEHVLHLVLVFGKRFDVHLDNDSYDGVVFGFQITVGIFTDVEREDADLA
jgi:hypothetical protein